MKTYINKIVLAGLCSLILSMSSCESFLREEPKDFLSPDNLPNTESECNMLLLGTIAYWRSNNFERHINFIAEATTDAVVSASKNNIPRDEMNSLTWQNDNESLYKPWQQFYACINAANIMIQKVPNAAKVTEDVQNRYVAAARYMRAMSYFYLVRIFNDVIYLDAPVEDFSASTNLPKTSALEIYNHIIEDLEYAENNLPVKWSEGTERPTVAAAKSLLAWVYITMAGEQIKDHTMWAKAAAKAKEVINNESAYGIELLPDYEDLWKVSNRFNKESIFALNFAEGLGDNQCGAEWRPSNIGKESGWGFFYSLPAFTDKFDDKDKRKAATFLTEIVSTVDNKTYTTANFASPYPHGKKWCDAGREDFSQRNKRTDMYIPIIRYADVLLIFAEAENEVNGPTADVYAAVNRLRARAGLDDLSGLSKDAVRQAIQKEWTLETAHERIYRFNLVRWGTYLTVMKEYFQSNFPEKVKNVTEERLYFPCPNHDAMINPNL